ncbi:E2/UBC family protein [Flaviaesturariibacter aridisoli]|uniref:Uncharacterized protein n=1 Tax=Flaviaesturariibacter aridisoli TaxID=2545761 RepID=A0A4R4DTR3_9BACT|nr:E2/UBC family protein [Flaviaesturariibacter aridisoli]TCZ65033.1 hypothetical protein E0486_17855 [Flaviaesturariibacter aridisoli]
MSLLFDEDYKYLNESNLRYSEDESGRMLVIHNYPLPEGMYMAGGEPISEAEVLVIIPSNYNMTGTDMLWTYPSLSRADNGPLPNVCAVGGGDNRRFQGKEFCRWSRHYDAKSWRAKVDNIRKILDRIEWALQNPSP